MITAEWNKSYLFVVFFTVVKDNEATNNNVEVSWNLLKAAIYEQYKKSRKAAGGGGGTRKHALYLLTYLLHGPESFLRS